MKRIIIISLGYGCLALGVLGLFLPILQGVLFIAIGLMILAPYQRWAGRMIEKLEDKFPSFRAVRVQAKRRTSVYLRRINKRWRTAG